MAETKAESTEVWTVGRIIEWTTRFLKDHGSDTPRLDTEILLAHVRSCSRIQLYTSFDVPLTSLERSVMRDLVKRRSAAEPVAYLVGHREFFGLQFLVNKNVLIPRPDTETLLVELLDLARPRGVQDGTPLAFSEPSAAQTSDGRDTEGEEPSSDSRRLVEADSTTKAIVGRKRDTESQKPYRILDLCTGSGCIAISIAVHLKGAQIVATDISSGALDVAKENSKRHGVADRVTFLEGDLFSPLSKDLRFDFIVSNPPYIPTSEIPSLEPDVRNHEPLLALDGGVQGMDILQKIVTQASQFLNPEGWLLLETGIEQAPLALEAVNQRHEFTNARIAKDLGGRPRVVLAQKTSQNT